MMQKEFFVTLTRRELFVVDFVDRFAVVNEEGYWDQHSTRNKIVFKIAGMLLKENYFEWLRRQFDLTMTDVPDRVRESLYAELDKLKATY